MAMEYYQQDKVGAGMDGNLRPGERILWESTPVKSGILEGVHGKHILQKWMLAAAIILGLLGAYMVMAQEVRGGICGILLVILAAILLSPVQEWNALQKQRFLLTNQRAILIRGDQAMFTMEMSEIDDAKIVQFSPKEVCLVLGSQITKKTEQQLRWIGAHPVSEADPGQREPGLVFYGVQNAEKALSLVSERSAA